MSPTKSIVALLVLALVALGFGCGGSDEEAGTGLADTGTTQDVPGWVASRLREKAGEDVSLTFGNADHAIGENRISFVIVRGDGGLVQKPNADVIIVREGTTSGLKTDAHLVPLGPHSHPEGTAPHDHPETTDLYVMNAKLSSPGRYWLVAEPRGASIQAAGSIQVRTKTRSPSLGAKAISVDNPTVSDAPAAKITTARPPDTALLRYSIADSLRAGRAFVVAFATPAFCESRTCGPTVEVVDKVRRTFERRGIRFIHVEIYEGNDPSRGLNDWFGKWKLPSEPWVFIVDRKGLIRAKFEGAVSVEELDAAVRKTLL